MPIRKTDKAEILACRGLHLFHFATSNCAMRIRVQLAEKGIEWVDRYMDIRAQKNLTPEYFDIHPQGLVPAIIHDGVIVYESADILLYIEEHFPKPSLLPKGEPALAEMHEWLEFTRTQHVSAIKTWAYGRNRKPTKTPESMPVFEKLQKDPELLAFHRMTMSEAYIPEAQIKSAEEVLLERFARIDAMVADKPYMQGDAPTLADVAWIPQYALLQRNDFPFAQFPNFMAWVDRWKQRPSYREGIAKWMPSAA
jgi:glutathione S-transferase